MARSIESFGKDILKWIKKKNLVIFKNSCLDVSRLPKKLIATDEADEDFDSDFGRETDNDD